LVASIIIGVILVLIGFNFGVEAIKRLVTGESTHFGLFAIIVTAVSMVVKEGMAQYSLYASRTLDSLPLKADAWHHRSDAISSLVILIGIMFNKIAWWIDGALGLVVAVLIIWTAWKIVSETIDVILGKKPDGKLVAEVGKIANEVAGQDVLSHHFHIHSYGDHEELTFHIVLPGDMPLKQVDITISKIETELKERLDVEPTIQVDAGNQI
jgi:cation diffusion facilitator family transporter